MGLSGTVGDCRDCRDCRGCTHCRDCRNCSDYRDCRDCWDCPNGWESGGCRGPGIVEITRPSCISMVSDPSFGGIPLKSVELVFFMEIVRFCCFWWHLFAILQNVANSISFELPWGAKSENSWESNEMYFFVYSMINHDHYGIPMQIAIYSPECKSNSTSHMF